LGEAAGLVAVVPPPAWLGDDVTPGADDAADPGAPAGVLAAGGDVCVAPGAAAGADELDEAEHPAMAPARASAVPASSSRLARADEIMNCSSFGHASKAADPVLSSSCGKRYSDYDARTALPVGTDLRPGRARARSTGAVTDGKCR
jgi:hypothetical protein